MRMVDIYELEGHLADVLDQLRETGETVAVTRDDEIIAHLMPTYIPEWMAKAPDDDVWARLNRLSAEISAHWPKGVSAVDAIRDVRREL